MSQTLEISENFTGTAGNSVIRDRSSQVGGGTWSSVSGTADLDGNGGAYCASGSGAVYLLSTVPTSPVQQVVATFKWLAGDTHNNYPSILLRASGSNTDRYSFGVVGYAGSTNPTYGFGKSQGGNNYTLSTTWYNGASAGVMISSNAAGVTTTLTAQIINISGGTAVQITLYDGPTLVAITVDSSPGTNLLTNAQIGFVVYGGSTGISTSTTGVHIGAFTLQDYNVVSVYPNDASLVGAYSPIEWLINQAGMVATLSGAEINFKVSSTSLAIQFDLTYFAQIADIPNISPPQANTEYPAWTCSVDDGPEFAILTAATGNAPGLPTTIFSGLSAGIHTVKLFPIVCNSRGTFWSCDTGGGLGPIGAFRILQFIIDSGSAITIPIADTPTSGDLLEIGDSITYADYSFNNLNLSSVNWYGYNQEPRTCFSYRLGESALNMRTHRIAYGGTGWAMGANGLVGNNGVIGNVNDSVPSLYYYLTKFDSANTRPLADIATTCKYVAIYLGTNDVAAIASSVINITQFQTAVTLCINTLCAILTNAKVRLYMPWGDVVLISGGRTSIYNALVAGAAASNYPNAISVKDIGIGVFGPTYSNTKGISMVSNSGPSYESADNSSANNYAAVHPNTYAHALIRAAVAADLATWVNGGVRTTSF